MPESWLAETSTIELALEIECVADQAPEEFFFFNYLALYEIYTAYQPLVGFRQFVPGA